MCESLHKYLTTKYHKRQNKIEHFQCSFIWKDQHSQPAISLPHFNQWKLDKNSNAFNNRQNNNNKIGTKNLWDYGFGKRWSTFLWHFLQFCDQNNAARWLLEFLDYHYGAGAQNRQYFNRCGTGIKIVLMRHNFHLLRFGGRVAPSSCWDTPPGYIPTSKRPVIFVQKTLKKSHNCQSIY